MENGRAVDFGALGSVLLFLGNRVIFPKYSECWLVTITRSIKHKDGTTRKVGYVACGRRKVYTNRMMYEACFGKIDRSTVITTTCDNSECINPDHLLAVRKNNLTKTPIDKKAIRRINRSIRRGNRVSDISAREGVSRKFVQDIKRGMVL